MTIDAAEVHKQESFAMAFRPPTTRPLLELKHYNLGV